MRFVISVETFEDARVAMHINISKEYLLKEYVDMSADEKTALAFLDRLLVTFNGEIVDGTPEGSVEIHSGKDGLN